MERTTVGTEIVTLNGADVQTYFDGLPKLLTKELNVVVSGSIPDELVISNFYGSGSITLRGNEGATASACRIKLYSNYLRITVVRFSFRAAQNDQVLLDIYNSSFYGTSLSFSGNGYTGVIGCDSRCGLLFFNISEFSELIVALRSEGSSVMTVRNCTGADNNIGLSAYQGGIILLQDTPALLGGATNTKYGGLIVNTDGTLL